MRSAADMEQNFHVPLTFNELDEFFVGRHENVLDHLLADKKAILVGEIITHDYDLNIFPHPVKRRRNQLFIETKPLFNKSLDQRLISH